MEDYLWSRDYIDFLADFPNLSFTPQEFVDNLDRLKPRLYSIASSPDAHPGAVELTVAIVRYHHHGRDKGGLCTIYMADHALLNDASIPMFMSPTRSFVLPADGATDIIMVGPGTGIAPFRAFLEQREFDGATGRNWLSVTEPRRMNTCTAMSWRPGGRVVISTSWTWLGRAIRMFRRPMCRI